MRKRANEKLLDRIPKSIRQARISMAKSQMQVYRDTGIHIGRIESGDVDLRVSTLASLCDYFGMRLSEFLGMVEKGR